MKTLLLLVATCLFVNSSAQSSFKYQYKLKLTTSPAKYSVMEDTSAKANLLKVYVTDFLGNPLPFCTIQLITENVSTTFTSDVMGFLQLHVSPLNWTLSITSPSYSMFILNSEIISIKSASILKVMMTFDMSSKVCQIISSKSLDSNQIDQIAKKYSANPFDPEISKSKTFGIICQQ